MDIMADNNAYRNRTTISIASERDFKAQSLLRKKRKNKIRRTETKAFVSPKGRLYTKD
jgi:hypothetical protein